MQDLHRQLDALSDLRGFLEMLHNELVNQLNGYRNRTQNLREIGISNEVAGNYENSCFTVNESYLTQLINNIEDDDIPYINRQIQAVEDAIGEANRR